MPKSWSAPVQEKALRTKIQKSYIVLETRKDGTKFTSKRLREHAHDLNDATKQYADAQRSLVDSVRPARRPGPV